MVFLSFCFMNESLAHNTRVTFLHLHFVDYNLYYSLVNVLYLSQRKMTEYEAALLVIIYFFFLNFNSNFEISVLKVMTVILCTFPNSCTIFFPSGNTPLAYLLRILYFSFLIVKNCTKKCVL
ncbi:Protein of unknown function [Gryllus bimaculatus]|nr:Protein of unknown function [Gryllus bimaculatus]